MLSSIGKTPSEDQRTIMIYVDSYQNQLLYGRLHICSQNDVCSFQNAMQMLSYIDQLLNEIDCPRSATEKRFFSTNNWQQANLLQATDACADTVHQGNLATFKLRILFRQNASWQGMITWLEGNCQDSFRSALEMLMMMDSALSSQTAAEPME